MVTSSGTEYCGEEILYLYRRRCQVEIVFKRYKSIFGAGSVPVKTKESTEAWINGKIMFALLIE